VHFTVAKILTELGQNENMPDQLKVNKIDPTPHAFKQKKN
jgi:hypothetical protein